MIAIVAYGLGNTQAFVDVYKRLNVPVMVARDRQELEAADKIILPGVGAFDWAMERLNASGMRDTLDEIAADGARPVLGVCVGMQIMARRSEEGVLPGLGWIPGEVRRLVTEAGTRSYLPHMGWNTVAPVATDALFADMQIPRFYFLHSYRFCPDSTDEILATTEYNGQFASAVRFGNLFGTQFHPEKSHQAGVSLLKNFAEF